MILVIYSHPNPKSFNHAVLTEVVRIGEAQGAEVVVRDLYELNFQPVLSGEELVGHSAEGNISLDVLKEQEYITRASCILFVFPIWWFGLPAILKGYIERVFSYGFAYHMGPEGIEGLLKTKKVGIVNTTGGTGDQYVGRGLDKAVLKTIDDGIFRFCGMKVAFHKILYAVPTISQMAREKMIDDLKKLFFLL